MKIPPDCHVSRRPLAGLRIVLLWWICALAQAAEPETIEISGVLPTEVVTLAQRLMEAGQLDDAGTLLQQLEQDGAGGTDREFQQGLLALATGDYRAAEDRFRAIIDQDPALVRVRLELARALFLQRDDEAADYHFRLALTRQPPDSVVTMVNRFRQGIRDRRAWRFDFGAGLAPDSNINGATNRKRVELFGLPFELDEDARARSGVGLATSIDASYRFRRDTRVPVYVGTYVRSLRYGEDEFNDEVIGFEAGPELRTPIGTLRTTATALTRRYGGEVFEDSLGARAQLDAPIARSWSLGATLEARNLEHAMRADLDGNEYGAAISASRVLGPATIASVWGGVRRTTARFEANANRAARIGTGLSHEFGWGLRLGVGAELSLTDFDEPAPLFDERRRDWSASGVVTLAKRDWSVAGFAPLLRVSYLATESSIDLHDSDRWRAEIGMTRAF